MATALSHFGPQSVSARPLEAPWQRTLTWSPDTDVVTRHDLFVVRVDLPGVSEHDIWLEISRDELTIIGERRSDLREADDSWQNEERPYGRFFRRVPLPVGASPTRACATLASGILEITVPVSHWVS